MAASPHRIAAVLLRRHGRTFCSELGIDLESQRADEFFRWLCTALLLSARIRTDAALRAARALSDRGWTTPEALLGAGWGERVLVLNQAGYARYDESTARMLGDSARLLIDRYAGDLGQLRERADRRPDQERKLLKEFKGIGDVGANIFCREAQMVWSELRPFADRKALLAAANLGLGDEAAALQELVGEADYTRLIAALVRSALAGDHADILRQAEEAESD